MWLKHATHACFWPSFPESYPANKVIYVQRTGTTHLTKIYSKDVLLKLFFSEHSKHPVEKKKEKRFYFGYVNVREKKGIFYFIILQTLYECYFKCSLNILKWVMVKNFFRQM